MKTYHWNSKKHICRALIGWLLFLGFLMGSCCPVYESQPTFTASLDALITPAFSVEQNCFSLVQDQVNVSIRGKLVIRREDLEYTIAHDLFSRDTIILGGWIDSIRISPDNSTIAISDVNTNLVTIISEGVTRTYPIPDEKYYYIQEFLSDDRIILTSGISPELTGRYVENEGYSDEFYVMSTQTGEVTFNSIFLPYYWATGRIANSFIVYSPDLHYVIYTANKNLDMDDYHTILFDIVSNKIVWEGNGIGIPTSPAGVVFPVWQSSKSVTFPYVDDNEVGSLYNGDFYNLFPDGRLLRMTQIERITESSYELKYPSWSPDGRFLAFVVSTGSNRSLAILDLLQNKLLFPCYQDTLMDNNQFLWDGMAWSPDSRYLAILQHSGDLMYATYILDLYNQVAYEYPFEIERVGYISLVGWLNWNTP